MDFSAKKLRELDNGELRLRAAELQKEMFDLRKKVLTKELEDTSVVRNKRRDYARLLTVLREKKA